MKNLLLLIAFVFTCVFTFGQDNGKVYAEKSGKVVYHYEINDEASDFTLIFDDYGKKQAMEMLTNAHGEESHIKTIILPDKMSIVNYADKQVIIFPIVGNNNMNMAQGADMGVDVSAIVNSATSNGSVKKGTENILGKECTVYEHSDGEYKGKYWIYKNHLAKAEFIADGVHTFMEAKEIKLGVAIAASEFEAPKDFTIMDMAKQMQQMQGIPTE